MSKKLTKKELFRQVLEYAHPEHVEFLEKEIARLEKRTATGEKRMTAAQKQNVFYKSNILENMEPGTLYDIPTLIDVVFPEVPEMTSHKIAALLGQLVKEEEIVRVKEGKKTFYRLAEAEEFN